MTLNGPVADLFGLDGRVALVTGAGGAFGRAIALGFADAGASVFLTDFNSERLDETAALVSATGAQCETWVADSGSSADVDAAFAHLDQTFNKVDILVHNAVGNPMHGPPEGFPRGVWEGLLKANLPASLPHPRAPGNPPTPPRTRPHLPNP